MKQSFRILARLTAASALAAASLPALAQSAGSNIVNLGWFHFDTHDSSDPLTIDGVGTIPGSGASVGNADTLGIAFTHFYTDNFALTADFGIPPKFNLDSRGLSGVGISDGSHLGSARQWSPALLAKWFFGGAEDKFRPFIGAGVTYVWYSDVNLSQSLNTVFTGGAGTTSAKLSSSFAPIANVGAVYNFNKTWSVGLSVSYIWLDTDADITGKVGNTVVSRAHTSLTLDPLVTFLSVGYRF
jgi:outer membrane protein